MAIQNRIRIQTTELLSDDWYTLKKTTFDYLRNDGTWQRQSRETYDRGNGAVILLYNSKSKTVILTKQFRYPAYVNDHKELLIEAPAGLLEQANPEERIKDETQEETGYKISSVNKLFEAFMSPGSVTEKLYFYMAEYSPKDKTTEGGGHKSEGGDIDVLELPFETAFDMIASGEIVDAKTIMLLYHAKLFLFQ